MRGVADVLRSVDHVTGSTSTRCIFTTAVDRSLKIYSTADQSLLDSHQFASPILSLAVHPTHPRLVLIATMSGALSVLDLVSRQTLASVHLHDKYVVKLAVAPNGRYAASLGYDKKVVVYEVVQLPPLEGDEPALLDGEEPDELAGTPRVELRVAHERATRTNPEGATFLPGSDHLVYSCRDDHLLHYLSMPGKEGQEGFESTTVNLNENGDSWVSFSGQPNLVPVRSSFRCIPTDHYPLPDVQSYLSRSTLTSPSSPFKPPPSLHGSCCTRSTRRSGSRPSTRARPSPNSSPRATRGCPTARASPLTRRTASSASSTSGARCALRSAPTARPHPGMGLTGRRPGWTRGSGRGGRPRGGRA